MKRRQFAADAAFAALAFPLAACAGADKQVQTALDEAGQFAEQARAKIRQGQLLIGKVLGFWEAWRGSLPGVEPTTVAEIDELIVKAQQALTLAEEYVAQGSEFINDAKSAYNGNFWPLIDRLLTLLGSIGLFAAKVSQLQPPMNAKLLAAAMGDGDGPGVVRVVLPASEL